MILVDIFWYELILGQKWPETILEDIEIVLK